MHMLILASIRQEFSYHNYRISLTESQTVKFACCAWHHCLSALSEGSWGWVSYHHTPTGNGCWNSDAEQALEQQQELALEILTLAEDQREKLELDWKEIFQDEKFPKNVTKWSLPLYKTAVSNFWPCSLLGHNSNDDPTTAESSAMPTKCFGVVSFGIVSHFKSDSIHTANTEEQLQ